MRKFVIAAGVVVFAVVLFGHTSTSSAAVTESTWHGQFRINSYYQIADGFGTAEDTTQQASRLRWRPTWDLTLDGGITMHTQFNIGHITGNSSNARYDNSGTDPAFALRHAVLNAPAPILSDWTLTAGLVPLSDKFGDTLFSGDWDFNPLAYGLSGNMGGMDVRVFHGNLNERGESVSDDVEIWIVDADTSGGFGASFYNFLEHDTTDGVVKATQSYAGVRYVGSNLNGWVVYNIGTRHSGATDVENTGFAAKVAGKAGNFGIMAVYATGDKDYQAGLVDSDAFITPNSLIGHTGYWGYTGKLNVQGPTDAGIDSANINIDGGAPASNNNLGYGVTTVQVNTTFPIGGMDGYAAAGWFVSNDTPDGIDDNIGFDIYVQSKYKFDSGLNLEFGVDYLSAGEGHHDSTALGANLGETRTVVLAFSRLQLEF